MDDNTDASFELFFEDSSGNAGLARSRSLERLSNRPCEVGVRYEAADLVDGSVAPIGGSPCNHIEVA
jgi:hypothetical protein